MRLLPFLLLFLSTDSAAQQYYAGKKTAIRFTDRSGEKIKEEEADLLIAVTKVNDTLFRKDVYKAYGPLEVSHSYKTNNLDELHGRTIEYKKNGLADQFGFYLNGQKEGEWLLVNDSGRIYKKQYFLQGKLTKTEEVQRPAMDSSKPLGDEFEAQFTGGFEAWRNYLQTNMNYPKKAIKLEIKGTVTISFIVNKDGTVNYPFPYRSVYYYLDMEALRLIENSPAWKPAYQNNQPVASFFLQSISFKLSN